MSRSLHTPGPWRVGKGSCVVATTKSHPRQDDNDLGYYGGYPICESMAGANADLIATAPDFSEVLGHPGFRSVSLVLDVSAGASKWLYRVDIAVSSNFVQTFFGDYAVDAIALAATFLRQQGGRA